MHGLKQRFSLFLDLVLLIPPLIFPCHHHFLNLRTILIIQLASFELIYREYFMESAGVRYLQTSCFCIRNRTSQRSERVRFLIQKRVGKYRTKHFTCGIVFIVYILRHSSFWGLFILNLSKMLKFAAHEITIKTKYQLLVETFLKNINDDKDMR